MTQEEMQKSIVVVTTHKQNKIIQKLLTQKISALSLFSNFNFLIFILEYSSFLENLKAIKPDGKINLSNFHQALNHYGCESCRLVVWSQCTGRCISTLSKRQAKSAFQQLHFIDLIQKIDSISKKVTF